MITSYRSSIIYFTHYPTFDKNYQETESSRKKIEIDAQQIQVLKLGDIDTK